MKNRIQIAAGILATYVLFLPLVLVFHAHTHSHHTAKHEDSGAVILSVDDDSDCQICDFYFDQQWYVHHTVFPSFEDGSHDFVKGITEVRFTAALAQLHLRGPPRT